MKLYSIEAEQIVIGSIINDTENYFNLGDLKPDDFFEPLHQAVFTFLQNEISQGRDLNLLIVTEKFSEFKNLIILASSMAIGILRIYSYGEMIKGFALKRGFLEKITSIKNNFSNETDIYLELDELNRLINSLREVSEVKTITQLGKEIFETLEEETSCFSTGISALDESMQGGLYTSKFYCIAAAEKVGKTITLGTISRNLSLANINHMFLALEMGCKEILQRSLSVDIGVNPVAFFNKKQRSSPVFKQRLADSLVKNKFCGYMVDAPSVDFNRLVNLIVSSCRKYKLKGVILDYLQLVTGKFKNENDSDFQGRVAQKLAEICKKEDIFILTAAQLNREGQLYGSNGIKKAVDQLYFLHKAGSTEFDKNLRYMTCEASRYTMQLDVGSKEMPVLEIDKISPILKMR